LLHLLHFKRMIPWQHAWAGVHNACLPMWLVKPVLSHYFQNCD